MNPRHLRLIVAVRKVCSSSYRYLFRFAGSTKRRFNGPELWPVDTAAAALYVRKGKCEIAPRQNRCIGVLCGYRECRRLGGNAPEDRGSGLLNGFQALAQEVGVSVPKLDIVLGRGSVLKSDRLADHKGHGFGFGFADLLRGHRSTLATVEHFVSDLMHECGELLGWLHPG